ncbi:hypothetical protein [Larkinella terrae]|uniref:Uncharacterized protein n=1 Tax=Larkinella terrae TaxID=2025311 RepID=A0A7K0EU22_9BACT|nr:hypothetical protein [Larkinella terrae]MRS65303.1 hypothetical protein [Larkinella terrae]
MAAPTPEELNLYLSQIEPVVTKILAHKSTGKAADLPEQAVPDITARTLGAALHIRRVAIRQRLQLAAFAKRLTLEQITLWQAVHGSPRKQAEAMNQIMAENQAGVARFLTGYSFRTTDQRNDVLNESFRTFFGMIDKGYRVTALISTVVKGVARYKALKELGSDRKNAWEWLESVYESSGDDEIGTFDYPLTPDERLAPESVDLRLVVKPDKKESEETEPDDTESEEPKRSNAASDENDSQPEKPLEDELTDIDFNKIALHEDEPDEANSDEEKPAETESEEAAANAQWAQSNQKESPETLHIRVNFRQLQSDLADCLKLLKDPRRVLVRLKYAFWRGYDGLLSEEQMDSSFDKLNMKEIAELAGYKDAHTASVRLGETRKTLKKCLESKLTI